MEKLYEAFMKIEVLNKERALLHIFMRFS